MNTVELITALEATRSRTEKEALLIGAWSAGNREFFEGAQLAMDPLLRFGVRQAPIRPNDALGDGYSFSLFRGLLDRLSSRALTGNAARDAVQALCDATDAQTWNGFYRRVLIKDFRVGVDATTINKVLKDIGPETAAHRVPVYECQLAQDGAKNPHAKKLRGVRLHDVKLDGVRLNTFMDQESGVSQFTRNGLRNSNFTAITEALERVLPHLPGSWMLDGEITALSFQALMTQVNRRDGIDTSTSKLAVFDAVPLDEFLAGECRQPQEHRDTWLAQWAETIERETGGLVYVLPKRAIDLDTEAGQAEFAQFNKDALLAGYEGIMSKDPAAPYRRKRTDAWLKVKPWIDVTLEVIAIEDGDADGKYAGLVGALVCRGEVEGRRVEVNVGSGLTDEQRAEFKANPDYIVGMMIEVRADAMTQNRNATDTWSLRFPRVKGLRGGVPGEVV